MTFILTIFTGRVTSKVLKKSDKKTCNGKEGQFIWETNSIKNRSATNTTRNWLPARGKSDLFSHHLKGSSLSWDSWRWFKIRNKTPTTLKVLIRNYDYTHEEHLKGIGKCGQLLLSECACVVCSSSSSRHGSLGRHLLCGVDMDPWPYCLPLVSFS